MQRTQNFQIMLHFNVMSGSKYKILKCNMYNLNISQVVCHTFYRRCFFVYDNSVCQKCFDLVFRSNQKLLKILKHLTRKRNGILFPILPREETIYLSRPSPRLPSITSSSEDHQLSLESRPVIKIHGCNALFESKIDAGGRNEIREETFLILVENLTGILLPSPRIFYPLTASRPPRRRRASRGVISGIV